MNLRRRFSLGALAPAVLVTALAAQSASIEDRLKFLESSLQTLRQENATLRQQLGWEGPAPAPAIVRSAGSEPSLRLGGAVQGQGEFGGNVDPRFAGVRDRFFLRRARLSASGSLAGHFDFKLEADFGAGGTGERTGLTTQITDAYVNWNAHPAATLRFGQFKTPFGFEQLVTDSKTLTIERSLPNDRLTDGRQIGFGASGALPGGTLSYSLGAFNGTGTNTSANDNSHFLWAGRLSARLYDGRIGEHAAKLTAGLNGLVTRDQGIAKGGCGFDTVPGGTIDNLFSGRRSARGLDAQARIGRLGLDLEYLRADYHPNNRVPYETLSADGWSALASWFVVPQSLQAIARYEIFDPNTLSTSDESELWTFGLTWLIKGDDLKFAFNYLVGDPAGSTARQHRLLTRVQLLF